MSSYNVFDDDDCLGGEYGYYGDYIHGQDVVDEDYLDEQWMPVEGIPGYSISTHGRVWSGKTHRFLKAKPMDSHGHLGVCLHDGGSRCLYKYIHRLMAEAFIQNPNNLPIVRHLNDIPSDNSINNLAWGTQKDNSRDSYENGNAKHPSSEEAREYSRDRMIPIDAINESTGEVIRFDCINDAARGLGLQQSNVWKVLNKQRKHTCGYSFRRRGDNE